MKPKCLHEHKKNSYEPKHVQNEIQKVHIKHKIGKTQKGHIKHKKIA